jgi:Nuclease-related domain/UvrD-like helicase C-terminal domain/AAA domain
VARMIPDYYEKELRSRGEKEVFELFKNAPGTEDWVVLHSLGISRHVKRVEGEIDFVVLAPRLGIFCLEVKAGEVRRENGVWIYKNLKGREFKKAVGPFEQARDGMYSLRDSIRKRFGNYGRIGNLLFEYGVMFTDIEFKISAPDIDQWKVYDVRDKKNPVTEYIIRLHQEKKKKLEQSGVKIELPDKKDIEQLVSYLRKDFDFVVPFWYKEELVEKDIIRLTEEQYICLDYIQFNDRVLFEGGPGTGKTMLAVESARRSALKRERVLFLCFNNLLADTLKKRLEEYPLVEVSSFHRFLRRICKGVPFRHSGKYFYETELPEKAFEILVENGFDAYDRLIIDEGQDLIRKNYLDVMDLLVKNGLSGGRWQIFCDLEHQAIYSEQDREEMLSLLEKESKFTSFRLQKNCRNTKFIAEHALILSEARQDAYTVNDIEGFRVDYWFYNDEKELTEKVAELLKDLVKQGTDKNSITLLSPKKLQNSALSSFSHPKFRLHDLTVSSSKSPGEISFCTIHSYKGLENNHIIITDIDDLESDWIQELLYVGMTRAKVKLFMFIHHDLKDAWNQKMIRGIQQ